MKNNLWLTQIRINPRNKSARADLRSITAMHRTVMSMFPHTDSDSARSALGVLHRLDATGDGAVLLVQSRSEPVTDSLPAGYGDVKVISLVPLIERLMPGTGVRYRLLANATKRVAVGNRAGQRIALGAQATSDWWDARSQAIGLELVGEPQFVSSSLTGSASSDGKVTLRPWQIDGTAVVVDPERLVAAIAEGIGRGKAYGCGLLSLAPG